MLFGAVGEIWDVVKNLLAVGLSTGTSKAVITPAAVFGKCWLGFIAVSKGGKKLGANLSPVTSACCILRIPNSEPCCTSKCPLQGQLGLAVMFGWAWVLLEVSGALW